jgi:Zn-dependent protease
MFSSPGTTPYDLRFRLFGTPVRVHPLFWLVSALLGSELIGVGLLPFAIWIGCVFVSILLHEFGHVLAGRALGAHGTIWLYGFGGLAIGARDLPRTWQRVVVSLAGPGIQLGLFAVLYAVRTGRPELFLNLPDPVMHAFIFLYYINLYWPLFNLLPVWPLDGGMVVRDLATHASPRHGLRFSLGLSGAVAAAIAVNSLLAMKGQGFLPDWVPGGNMFTMLMFGLLAYESFQLMSRIPPAPTHETDDRLPWEREREPEPWER